MAKAPTNSVHPKTRKKWREWFEKNHIRTEGVWFIDYKKTTGKPRVEYGPAVEEALCFGWVDSKTQGLDDERSMIWFAPRRAGSGWSKSNKERVERLLEAGLMKEAGLAKIEAAKADGSWSALDAVENLEIPEDLEAEFAKYEKAESNFGAFPRSVKRSILEWISSAKREATRRKRVEETARLAEENVRANQWTPKDKR